MTDASGFAAVGKGLVAVLLLGLVFTTVAILRDILPRRKRSRSQYAGGGST